MFTNQAKNTGDLGGIGNFLPFPTSNSSEFRIGKAGKFTGQGPCMSAEQCQASRWNDRLKTQKVFGGTGNNKQIDKGAQMLSKQGSTPTPLPFSFGLGKKFF